MAPKFSEAWEDSDVVFIVEGESFHCHYCVIKLQSPVFRAMFSGNFKEEKSVAVPLPGKEKEPFRLFLELMYPLDGGEYPTSTKETMVKVLDYVAEYEVPSVHKHIDHMLYFTCYHGKRVYGKSKNAAELQAESLRKRYGMSDSDDSDYDYSTRTKKQKIYRDEATEGLLEDLKMCDDHNLSETRMSVYSHILNSDASLHDEPIFRTLSAETRFQLLAGLVKKYRACGTLKDDCSQLHSFAEFAEEHYDP